jgi:hypothetical protein
MRKLCIIHFHELQKYPPAINFIRFLSESARNKASIDVLTIEPEDHSLIEIPGVKIHRLGKWRRKMDRLERFFLYFKFNFSALFFLIRKSPDAILYYETLSAGAPWLFKKLFKKNMQICIHYHEYTSPLEYSSGMVLNKWLHKLERDSYNKANWVSHTNADRMRLFLSDLNGKLPSATYTLPNYPPARWRGKRAGRKDRRIGFVYVGALSMESMYVKETAIFVMNHKDHCYWDIYSTNLSQEVIEYLEKLSDSNINFKGGLPYDQLPEVLPSYDIGLILYKGHIPNYIYNVPNKLFEYHVCGLDVWFPHSMKSSLGYCTVGTYPRIIAVNFQALASIDPEKEADHSGLVWNQHEFVCEEVFKPLADKLINEHTV